MILFDGKGFVTGTKTDWEWYEFRETGPLNKTNKGTAFEEWAQRGQGRLVKITVAPRARHGFKDEDGNGAGSVLHGYGITGVMLWIPEFERTRQDPPFQMEMVVGEWEDGVMVEGDFNPSKTPVEVSNWALPKVGEKVLV